MDRRQATGHTVMVRTDRRWDGEIVALAVPAAATLAAEPAYLLTDTVLVGAWEETDDGILFSFDTDGEGEELDPPVEVLFEEQEDGSLVGVDFDTDLFGEELVLEMQQ